MEEEIEVKQEVEAWKGKINVSFNAGVHYSNARIMSFETAAQLEEEIGKMPGHIIAWMGNDRFGNILAVVSRELSQEEIDDLSEVSRLFNERREERERAKAESLLAQRQAQQEAEAQTAALVKLGRSCQEHHGQVLEDNRKLKAEVESLRKQVKKAQRA